MQKTLFSTYCRKGLTLIEIMIVVALIATMMTIGAIGLGVLGQSDVQGEALRLSSLVRYTFTTAATSNATLQMKLNFDDRSEFIHAGIMSLLSGDMNYLLPDTDETDDDHM